MCVCAEMRNVLQLKRLFSLTMLPMDFFFPYIKMIEIKELYVGLLILPCGIIFPFFSFFMNIFFFFFFCVQSTHISNISNIFNLTQPNLCVFFWFDKNEKNRIFIISKSEYVWHFLLSSCRFLSIEWDDGKKKKERCLEIVFTITKKSNHVIILNFFFFFLNTAWLD